jgi:gas vesicle protein
VVGKSSVWEVNAVRKVVNFLAGFFVGGLTGATVGLLLAPHSGPELQEQIRARVDALVEEGRDAAAARRAELENQLEAFKTGESLTIESTPKPS